MSDPESHPERADFGGELALVLKGEFEFINIMIGLVCAASFS
jgi:hypothetical protein